MPRQSTKTASFLISLLILISQGCGGGGSAGSKATVSGTAAFGAPAANATITVKGTNGVSKTTATGADGKYSLDVTGLSAPFLLRVDLATGSALYSVGGQAGVINIHPFTDLIIQTWYKVQNKTIVAAFNDPANNLPPSATEVKVIAVVAKEITQKWLADNGIDPATFDLISTPFDANSAGFDKVLDLTTVDANGVITISDGTTTQTTTVTANTTDGSATISTTTSSGGTTSSSVSSVVVPTSSAQQTALNGAGASLNQLATTVNSKGAALADTDLIGLLDAGYRNDGFGANIGAARLASELRGAKLNSVQVDRILSYDDTNKIISIAGTVSMTGDGVFMATSVPPAEVCKWRCGPTSFRPVLLRRHAAQSDRGRVLMWTSEPSRIPSARSPYRVGGSSTTPASLNQLRPMWKPSMRLLPQASRLKRTPFSRRSIWPNFRRPVRCSPSRSLPYQDHLSPLP